MSRGGRKHKKKLRTALNLYLVWVKYPKSEPWMGCPHPDIGFDASPTGLPVISCPGCGEYATGGGVELARKRLKTAGGAPPPTPPPLLKAMSKPGTGKTTGLGKSSVKDFLDKVYEKATEPPAPGKVEPWATHEQVHQSILGADAVVFGVTIPWGKLGQPEKTLLSKILSSAQGGQGPTAPEYEWLKGLVGKFQVLKEQTKMAGVPGQPPPQPMTDAEILEYLKGMVTENPLPPVEKLYEGFAAKPPLPGEGPPPPPKGGFGPVPKPFPEGPLFGDFTGEPEPSD